MLSTKGLIFSYHAGDTFRFPDLEVSQGAHMLIAGKSGSGKTSLLHLIAGLLRPTSGHIILNNTEVTSLKGSRLDLFRGRHIGMIFQQNYFIESVSMMQNLLAAQFLAGQKPDKAIAIQLMERLGIERLAHRKPARLSMGEKQRFSIARALINKPILVLADEPTSSLDDDNCAAFISLISEQVSAMQASLIVATHDARLKKHFNDICPL